MKKNQPNNNNKKTQIKAPESLDSGPLTCQISDKKYPILIIKTVEKIMRNSPKASRTSRKHYRGIWYVAKYAGSTDHILAGHQDNGS